MPPKTTNSKTNLYVLKLEGGRRYVGKSENPQKRIQQHFDGKGSVWTKKHKPISVEKIIPNVSHFDEDKVTKEMMSKYGIDKVRGGSYTSEKLSTSQKTHLEHEINGASDACYNCGSKGHFANNCKSSEYYDDSDNSDEYSDEHSDEEEISTKNITIQKFIQVNDDSEDDDNDSEDGFYDSDDEDDFDEDDFDEDED